MHANLSIIYPGIHTYIPYIHTYIHTCMRTYMSSIHAYHRCMCAYIHPCLHDIDMLMYVFTSLHTIAFNIAELLLSNIREGECSKNFVFLFISVIIVLFILII